MRGVSPADGGPAPGPAAGDDVKWWETAEDHRFALIVLQLPTRRDILRYIGRGCRSLGEIARQFGLDPAAAKYHTAMLAKALVIEEGIEGFALTSVGLAYLENIEQVDRQAKETS